MSRPSPEEVEHFLRETYEMDAQFWMEEDPMKRCQRCGAYPTARLHDYCANCSRDLCPECMAKGCCGKIPAESGVAADGLVDPFAEPSDDPPAGAEVEHCGTVTLEELDRLFEGEED